MLCQKHGTWVPFYNVRIKESPPKPGPQNKRKVPGNLLPMEFLESISHPPCALNLEVAKQAICLLCCRPAVLKNSLSGSGKPVSSPPPYSSVQKLLADSAQHIVLHPQTLPQGLRGHCLSDQCKPAFTVETDLTSHSHFSLLVHFLHLLTQKLWIINPWTGAMLSGAECSRFRFPGGSRGDGHRCSISMLIAILILLALISHSK